jgi:hypothetical protein
MRQIELRLRDLKQLFNSLDPSPFHEKDIDRDAEEFIVSWSREIPLHEPLRLRVYLGNRPGDGDARLVSDTIAHYFTTRMEHGEREFRQLMRQGRWTLVIGLVFLAVCFGLGEIVAKQGTVWSEYVRQSLTIAGWVAMWRPMQIYLYEWWPLRREIRNFARLAAMDVEVVASDDTR